MKPTMSHYFYTKAALQDTLLDWREAGAKDPLMGLSPCWCKLRWNSCLGTSLLKLASPSGTGAFLSMCAAAHASANMGSTL